MDAAEELMKVDGSASIMWVPEASRGVLMRKYATRGEYATPAQGRLCALWARVRACIAAVSAPLELSLIHI